MNAIGEADRAEARAAAHDLDEADRVEGCRHDGGFNRRGKSCHWCGERPER